MLIKQVNRLYLGIMGNFFRDKIEFDDLIFENRNKDYGAYLLRSAYNFNVVISILISSIIVSAFVVIPYIQTIRRKNDLGQEIRLRYVEVKMDKMELPKDEIIIPPPSVAPPPNTQANIKYVAPVVVDTVTPVEKALPTVADVQASNPTTDEITVTGTGNTDELLTGQEGELSDEPFMIVEVTPTFKGGDLEKFRDWVQKRANYPQMAQDNGISGKVFLTFVVERDGTVSNVKVVKGVDKLLDDEAVKAIQASPKWSPGLQRGRPVRVRFYIPLVFTLNR
jgi:protein TonB